MLPNFNMKGALLVKQRILSGAVIILFAAAIVLFNESFPMGLNIAIALIAGVSIWELLTALGIQKKLFLVWPSLTAAVLIPFASYLQCDPALILYIYTLVLFCGLLFHHKEVTFRELGMIYSMTLLIPAALGTLVSLRDNTPPVPCNNSSERGILYRINQCHGDCYAHKSRVSDGNLS